MAVAAILFSTEVEFDAATRSNIASSDGLLRFGDGLDLSSATGLTARESTSIDALGGNSVVLRNGTGNRCSATVNGASSDADQTVRVRGVEGPAVGGIADSLGLLFRWVDVSNYYLVVTTATELDLYKYVAAVFTKIASVAQAYAIGNVIDLRGSAVGTTITAYDDTNSISASVVDAAHASGVFGIYTNPHAAVHFYVRRASTATSGSASLPTSTTYVDLGSAKRMGSVSWDETLNGGDVTVDVYGSDNGTSDAAGASVTGLTDPAGSDCSAAGSHRYWRVVANFTRANTTQEPTIARIALNQVPAAAGGGGAADGSRRYDPREVLC